MTSIPDDLLPPKLGEWFIEKLKHMRDEHAYGSIEFKLEYGRIINCADRYTHKTYKAENGAVELKQYKRI